MSDDDDLAILHCTRVEDMPDPDVMGCIFDTCADCFAKIWVSPSSQMIDATRVCITCGFARGFDAEDLAITDEQRAELHAVGLTDEDIERAKQVAALLAGWSKGSK